MITCYRISIAKHQAPKKVYEYRSSIRALAKWTARISDVIQHHYCTFLLIANQCPDFPLRRESTASQLLVITHEYCEFHLVHVVPLNNKKKN